MARNIARNGLRSKRKPCADAHLHGRNGSLYARPIDIDPMLVVVKAQVHRRVKSRMARSMVSLFARPPPPWSATEAMRAFRQPPRSRSAGCADSDRTPGMRFLVGLQPTPRRPEKPHLAVGGGVLMPDATRLTAPTGGSGAFKLHPLNRALGLKLVTQCGAYSREPRSD